MVCVILSADIDQSTCSTGSQEIKRVESMDAELEPQGEWQTGVSAFNRETGICPEAGRDHIYADVESMLEDYRGCCLYD